MRSSTRRASPDKRLGPDEATKRPLGSCAGRGARGSPRDADPSLIRRGTRPSPNLPSRAELLVARISRARSLTARGWRSGPGPSAPRGSCRVASTPPRSNPRSVHPSSVLELSHRSKRPLTSHDSSHPSQTSARPRPSASAPSTRRGSRCVEFEYSPRALGSNDPLAPMESPGPRDRPFLTARVPSRVPQVIVERAEKSDIPDLDKKK